MDLKGKKLLILGGVIQSREIIKQAKKQGAIVYVTDYLKDSPGKKIADKSFMVSTTDVEGVVQLIKEESIDGVITGFLDSMLPYYQEICEKAGLPCYGSKEAFEMATNKKEFKELCRSFDVPVVEEYEIEYPFNKNNMAHIEYPVLVKPADNSGGRGIRICRTQNELCAGFQRARTFSCSQSVIVEEYMKAKEVSIFYLIQDGEIYLSAMADRYMKHGQGQTIPLPVAYTFPSVYLQLYQQTIHPNVMQMFKSIGLKNGMLFIQAFVDGEEIRFYEMGHRLTGTLEFKIIGALTGINPLARMLNFALTGEMSDSLLELSLNPNYDSWGYNITFLAKTGQIARVEGIEEARVIEGVLDIVLNCAMGDIIEEDDLGTLKQVVLRVLGKARTKEDMIKRMEEIHRLINVYSATGKDMLLEPCDSEVFKNNLATTSLAQFSE
jgi:biotin carboxylase